MSEQDDYPAERDLAPLYPVAALSRHEEPNPYSWATITAAAEELGVTRGTIYKWDRQDKLKIFNTRGGAALLWWPAVMEYKRALAVVRGPRG